eukprot:s246_g7.t1
MFAEKVASSLPGAKLAAVTRDPRTAAFYGVVYRQSIVDSDTVRVKAWLLRLSETEQGHFYWDDFVPVCGSCKHMLTPATGGQQCPVCQGRKGSGKCFQFDCRSSALRFGCESLPATNPRAYCGSHPFFGGYRLPDAAVGDAGPALLEEKIDAVCDKYTISIAAGGGSEVFVFPGYRSTQEIEPAKVLVLEGSGPAIISSYKMSSQGPYSAATLLTESPHHNFTLVQLFSGGIKIWRWVRDERPGYRADKAGINCPQGCRPYGKQIVRLRKGVVALSKRSLWAMDLSSVSDGLWGTLPRSATAADFANQVSWQKLMDLPLESRATEEKGEDEDDADEDEDEEDEELPTRLLAPGPKDNQVIIFKAEGLLIQPWLLVEMCGDSWGAKTQVTKITSTASVPWKRKEELYEPTPSGMNAEYCSLLPSVFRMSERHGGYLFFDQRGRSYRLRDEEILQQQDAWIAPSFDANAVQRIVTFKFPEESGAGRSCLFSVLERFEYFQKALENWQEGASAEVVVKDATTQTFDLLLRYFHTGTLDSELPLESLVGLLELGNKYLLTHLMALCMTKILRLLAKTGFIGDQEATLLANLLIVAAEANACGPFKFKIMDAIASSRPALTHDAVFLSRVSARSVDLLAHLLSVLHRRDRSCESVPKRRKIQCERQKILWSSSEVSQEPAWSTSGLLIEERPRLP